MKISFFTIGASLFMFLLIGLLELVPYCFDHIAFAQFAQFELLEQSETDPDKENKETKKDRWEYSKALRPGFTLGLWDTDLFCFGHQHLLADLAFSSILTPPPERGLGAF